MKPYFITISKVGIYNGLFITKFYHHKIKEYDSFIYSL